VEVDVGLGVRADIGCSVGADARGGVCANLSTGMELGGVKCYVRRHRYTHSCLKCHMTYLVRARSVWLKRLDVATTPIMVTVMYATAVMQGFQDLMSSFAFVDKIEVSSRFLLTYMSKGKSEKARTTILVL
jgi:hypothetical protein